MDVRQPRGAAHLHHHLPARHLSAARCGVGVERGTHGVGGRERAADATTQMPLALERAHARRYGERSERRTHRDEEHQA